MLKKVFFLLTLLSVSTASSVNYWCMMTKCFTNIRECSSNTQCNKMFMCLGGCIGKSEKCNIECTMEHGDGNQQACDFLSCLRDKKCMKLDGKKECLLPVNALTEFNMDTLKGSWWVLRGLSDIFDCYKCQRMTFAEPQNATEYWDYAYDMVIGKDSVIRTFQCHVKQNQEPFGRLTTKYTVQGVFDGTDDWHVLAVEGDFMLIYYCGSSEVHSPYQGAIVMTRDPMVVDLPPEIMDKFDTALLASGTGVSLQEFCKLDNSQCPQK